MSTGRPAKMPRRALRCDSSPDNKGPDHSIDVNKPANIPCELTYDILTIIFKKLNARDLRSAARVCRCWSEAAEHEKRVRGDSVLTFFGNVTNSWEELHPGEAFVDRLRVKPMLGLTFTNNFYYNPRAKHEKSDCPCVSLPRTCPNIIVDNRGVVTDQSEVFEENQQDFASVFLPEERDVTVEILCVPMSRKKKNQETAKKPQKSCPTDESKIESIIVLRSGDDAVGYNCLDDIPRDRYGSLWGGRVGTLAICKCDEDGKFCTERMAFVAILISGPSVRSWCIVLGRRHNTKERVEAKLKLMKNQVTLKKHSIGFMFACYARGKHMFGEDNVESTIFKKLFPEIPLVGSSGDGEFGDDTIEWMERRSHQYSTIFMIVTYG